MTQIPQTTFSPNRHKAIGLSRSKISYIYMVSYIYANLPINVIVRLSHPRSEDTQGAQIQQVRLIKYICSQRDVQCALLVIINLQMAS